MPSIFSPLTPGFRSVDALVHNQLYLAPYTVRFSQETLSLGYQFMPGTVLGLITATGLLVPCVKTVSDGSQVPYGVIVEFVDTTVATGTGINTNFAVVVSAHFNYTALTIDVSWGATIDLAWNAIKPQLRNVAITGDFPSYSG